MEPKSIVKGFFPVKKISFLKSYGNGHINTTYKLSFVNCKQEYILQKINTKVFKNPNHIIQNHLKLQNQFNYNKNALQIPYLIPTIEKEYLYTDENNDIWRIMNFIEDSYSIEVVKHHNQAYEAGKAFGWFLRKFSDSDPNEFKETIQDFHSFRFRLNQLNNAVLKNRVGRLSGVMDIVDFYKERELIFRKIDNLIQDNELPVRVVHNDTKINNLLFRENQAIAVIDLDTVGPGSVIYDYGDALRTIGNTSAEDEKETELVEFNLKAFEYFTKGYLEKTKSVLKDKELEFLYMAPIYMTYVMGIRFLADYLNGDKYYKIKYDNHNLIRCLVQKKLIEDMETKSDEMNKIIKKYTI